MAQQQPPQTQPAKSGLIQNAFQKLAGLAPGRARSGSEAAAPDEPRDAMGLLEELQSGGRPDYCLYVGPTKVKSIGADVEALLARGFAPLAVVPVDGYRSPLRRLPVEGRLAEEAFAMLATHARVLLLVPTADGPHVAQRVRWLRQQGHLWRAVVFMPDVGAFGVEDWSAAWAGAQRVVAPTGVELPPYTPGGWLFRYAIDPAPAAPRAATFRMIVHPNPEKIARALEAVCEEMTPG
jgi:hypothetical protein